MKQIGGRGSSRRKTRRRRERRRGSRRTQSRESLPRSLRGRGHLCAQHARLPLQELGEQLGRGLSLSQRLLVLPVRPLGRAGALLHISLGPVELLQGTLEHAELRAHGPRLELPVLGQHPLVGSLHVALGVHERLVLVLLLFHLVDLLLELGRLLGSGLKDALPAVLEHPLRHLLLGMLQLRGLARRPAVGPSGVLLHDLVHPLRRLLSLGLHAL
mmetsp:Transcript_885/g.2309  ORF Transcript_885/g.2309 Transcript_885/m.2309 type:complete len:215 (-) Transcript_885:365-1009(-)